MISGVLLETLYGLVSGGGDVCVGKAMVSARELNGVEGGGNLICINGVG